MTRPVSILAFLRQQTERLQQKEVSLPKPSSVRVKGLILGLDSSRCVKTRTLFDTVLRCVRDSHSTREACHYIYPEPSQRTRKRKKTEHVYTANSHCIEADELLTIF